MNVSGLAPAHSSTVYPVEISCHVCGQFAVFGGNGNSVPLDELIDWADTHECPRTLTVN